MAQNRTAHIKCKRRERQRRDGDDGGGVGRRRPRAEEALRLAAAAVPKYRWANGRIDTWDGLTDIDGWQPQQGACAAAVNLSGLRVQGLGVEYPSSQVPHSRPR